MIERLVRLRPGRLGAIGLCVAALALPMLTGCGPSAEEKDAAEAEQARDSEWAWLQETRDQLEALRAQRDELRNAPDPAEVPSEAQTEGEAAAAEPAAGGKTPEQLESEIITLADEFNRRLVDFINANPPVEGEPVNEMQQAAIRMKSDEDILLARDYIQEGGDYRRAIEIYNAALMVDPEYDRLQQALEEAQGRRYMTQEAFDQVKKGMTQAEVRQLLGQPNLHNVRDYPDRGVEAWFFPKNAEGAAAAVWFEKKGDAMTAYKLDYNAISGRGDEPEEG
jgi:hypothetical protein